MSIFINKIAIVTGAASGIGLSISKALWLRGATVILLDLSEEKLKKTIDSFSEMTRRLDYYPLNVTDKENYKQIIDKIVDKYGRIDYLFNNAGTGLAGEVIDNTDQDWQKMIDINLWGVLNGINLVYPQMIKQKSGYIVNTSSGAGLCPRPGMTAYTTIKHAIVGLSNSLRGEASIYNIKVSAVCPGFIATNIMNSTTYKNVDSQKIKDNIPKFAKPMMPDECADIVLKGLEKNKALIVITRLLKLDWFLYRLMPERMINFHKLRAKKFRESKINQ